LAPVGARAQARRDGALGVEQQPAARVAHDRQDVLRVGRRAVGGPAQMRFDGGLRAARLEDRWGRADADLRTHACERDGAQLPGGPCEDDDLPARVKDSSPAARSAASSGEENASSDTAPGSCGLPGAARWAWESAARCGR